MARFEKRRRRQPGPCTTGCALALVLAAYYGLDWQNLAAAVGTAGAWSEARLALAERESPSAHDRVGHGVTIVIAPEAPAASRKLEAPGGGAGVAELVQPPMPRPKRGGLATARSVGGSGGPASVGPEAGGRRDAGAAMAEPPASPERRAARAADEAMTAAAIRVAKLAREMSARAAADAAAADAAAPLQLAEWAVPPEFDRASAADMAQAKAPGRAGAPRYQPWLEPDPLSMKVAESGASPERSPSRREDEEFQLIASYRVPRSELAGLRGGFTTPSGLEINFGVTVHSIVNGVPQLTTVLTTGDTIGDAVSSLATGATAHVNIGNNGGVFASEDVDVASAIQSGEDVVLSVVGPPGTEVSHLIGPNGVAVEVLNINDNLFVQTQTEISLVLENMSEILPVLEEAQTARNISNALRDTIVESLGN